jgi:predicted MarR family transcription regulator
MVDDKSKILREKLREPIVSSAHLAAGASPALSEFEFGLIIMLHAFERWVVSCMAASGVPNLSNTEVLILHIVRSRDRPKRFSDIARILDIEETHIITYAVRKLEAAKLLATRREGKEKVVTATRQGIEVCARFAAVREQLLVKPLRSSGPTEEILSDIGEKLRTLSGYYDQAVRAAATV